MSFASVIGIALVVGVVAVIGIAIVSYMSSLVRNAYEIKVEMRKDLDEGIKQAKAETIRQTKAARAELASEIERSRTGILEDLKTRHASMESAIAEELKKRDEAHQDEVENLHSIIQELRDQIETLEGRTTLRSRVKKPAGPEEITEETAPEEATPEAVKETQSPPAAENLKLASFDGAATVRRM